MTWLKSDDGTDLDWSQISGLFPDAITAIEDLHRLIWAQGDPVLLELSRLRMAELLRFEPGLRLRSDKARAAGLLEDKILVLKAWPVSPLYTPKERACLALTEQILLDAKGVTDELVEDVLVYLSPSDCYSLVEAISAMETLQRGSLVLGLEASPEERWLIPAPATGTQEANAR